MTRRWVYLLMCLPFLSGCSFAVVEKQWFQASGRPHARSYVTISTLGPPSSARPQYKYRPIVYFHDSDGTLWRVTTNGNTPHDWRVDHILPDGQRVGVPLIEVPNQAAASRPSGAAVHER